MAPFTPTPEQQDEEGEPLDPLEVQHPLVPPGPPDWEEAGPQLPPEVLEMLEQEERERQQQQSARPQPKPEKEKETPGQ